MMSIVNRLKLYKDFVNRKEYVSGLPVEIGIEMTNRCNLDCIMCARKEMTRPIGDMSFDLLKKIIDEVKAFADIVYLHGDGEPLLHKYIYDAISYAKQSNLKVGLSTNATVLNEKNASLLIDSKVDYLILALDGVTRETYEKIRVKGKYGQVLRNIQNFMDLRKKTRCSIYTIIQFIEMAENKHEAQKFYKYWKAYHPNVIRIKPYVELLQKKITKFNAPCFYLWRQTMIDWDGTVFPCCVDTNSKYKLGNIADKSLAQIWNETPILNFRNKHIAGKQSDIDICRTCDMPQLNNIAMLGVSLIDGYSIKKILPYFENLSYLYKAVFRRN